jgi:hypothetical protein
MERAYRAQNAQTRRLRQARQVAGKQSFIARIPVAGPRASSFTDEELILSRGEKNRAREES